MEPNQVYCVFDYETYSEADLKKCGAFEYSVHPSTEILCAAWQIGTRETLKTARVGYYAPGIKDSDIEPLLQAILDPEIILVAHNAYFEHVITVNVLFREFLKKHQVKPTGMNPARWLCTASLAAALALPRNLEGVCQVLKLPIQKDMGGNRLIKKWCKPRKPTKKDPSTRHTDREEFKAIVKYCMTDVKATTQFFLAAPPLTPTEREVWCLDQAINLRGFQVDRELVQTVLGLVETETKRLLEETLTLTDGRITSARQVAAILDWLAGNGCFLPNLQRKTVEDAIAGGLAKGKAKQLLENRLAISKSSTAKYQNFERRSRFDSRLRDNLMYHGSSTGRWSGTGVQPQNLYRPTMTYDEILLALKIIMGEKISDKLALIDIAFGSPMNVFANVLRSVIIAPKGKVLDVADYSAIEARVLFWLAKHTAGIQAFRDGRKMYEELAMRIFGVPMSMVDFDKRFLGKQATLGCGFQMGAEKFQATCLSLGQEISLELAKAAVETYRTVHAPVVKLWKAYQNAALAAVENVGTKYTINYTTWVVKNGFLWCILPSGRRLAYRSPAVEYQTTSWGEKRPVLTYYGTDSVTKRWVKQKTYGGKLVENCTQAVARDLMAAAMLRIEKTGIWKIVLSVHDELIAERREDEGTNSDFCKLMAEVPPWAEGCPIKVEGWSGNRYKK